MAPEHRPTAAQEKQRYLEHHNDVHDVRYQQFVSPITHAVLHDFPPETSGLDFGAGTGPVIATLLKNKGFTIRLYDPYFHPDSQALQQRYDFIICCEVMEHFFYPHQEFARLSDLLKPGGRLYCMTQLVQDHTDIRRWRYAHDPTHVFFYHAASIAYIKKQFNFSQAHIEERLIVFTKPVA